MAMMDKFFDKLAERAARRRFVFAPAVT